MRSGALWFNTGTLCNLTCRNCYIESSPTNDRLAYMPLVDVVRFLDEIAGQDRLADAGNRAHRRRAVHEPGNHADHRGLPRPRIFCPGADQRNAPDEACLDRGFSVLVLKHAGDLLRLNEAHGDRLAIRVSLDHYGQALHEMERGDRSWKPAIAGFGWLVENGFNVHVCGRTCWNESEESLRAGFSRLFAEHGIDFDIDDPVKLTLLPEMDETADVPEITEACWDILDVSPDAMMCATQRMVVKRKGEPASVVPCTLLPYEMQFDLGHSLADAAGEVKLNHPHCARFCVLGGGACSCG